MRIIILFLVAVFASCTAIDKQVKPSMSEGERLYRAHCSSCHRLYSPERYTFEKLEKYVNKYGRGMEFEDRQLLTHYLKETSREHE